MKAWPDQPLARLPRWLAFAILAAFLALGAWNSVMLDVRDSAQETDVSQRLDREERVDMDLYREINRRMATGESYYEAAGATHRAFGFPTAPFVTVRTPVLAWGTALFGEQGWRILAVVLWAANIIAWMTVPGASLVRRERLLAGVLAAFFGAIAFMPDIPFSHEALAGLMLSLALALRERSWIAALVLAGIAVALRELAAPFLLAWLVIALWHRSWREAAGIALVMGVLALGLTMHAAAVAEIRLASDDISPGWSGLIGLSLPLYGIHVTTLLQTLPLWIAGVLGGLPLLGWAARGGFQGAFALLWFGGFILAAALFARQENFYWMGLFVPAFGVGLAFLPRAIDGLVSSPA